MTDFESMVRDMVKNGASPEEVDKRFREAVAKIEAEKQADSAKSARDKVLENMRKRFNRSYDENDLDMADAAALCVLVCAPSYPDWTEQNIYEFFEAIQRTIQMHAELVGKTPVDALKKLLGDLHDEIAKAKDSTDKEDKPCKPDRFNKNKTCTCHGHMTPEDAEKAFRAFLHSL